MSASFVRLPLLLVSALGALAYACSDGTSPTQGSQIPDASAEGDSDLATDTSTKSDAMDSSTKADSSSTPTFPTNDKGCITYAGASSLCGGASDGSVCAFSKKCAKSSSTDQCSINCEMASTVSCYTNADAKCLLDALKSGSCTDIKACKWTL